jgi:sec-independent protein translocase protein TatA
MWGMSVTHWLIVMVVIALLFGQGKISALLGDVGDGIRALRNTMREDL